MVDKSVHEFEDNLKWSISAQLLTAHEQVIDTPKTEDSTAGFRHRPRLRNGNGKDVE